MAVEKLVTLEQFQKDPKLQAEFGGDYNKYLSTIAQELKEKGIFNVGKFLRFVNDNSIFGNKINEEIYERSKEADKQKAIAEEIYYAALEAERDAEKAQKAAERHLEEMIASYSEGDYHITEAKNKLRNLIAGTSNATLAREIAGDRMVDASKVSLRAFQSSMVADAMLGQNFNKRT